MEDIFKRNLLSLRNPSVPKTFSEALLGSGFMSTEKKTTEAAAFKKEVTSSYSEKKQVLESFERFAQEQVATTSEPLIKIDGGEIIVKSTPGWEVPVSTTQAELKAQLSVPAEMKEVIFKGKNPGSIEVFFVTESFREWNEVQGDLKGGFLDELLLGFSLKTAELFERMITAMKLTPDQVILYPVEWGEKDLSSEAMRVAAYFKPQVVVTLGAKASNQILKGNDRLSLIHGQFFVRNIKNAGEFQVVPLFHPSIIESNQNMKKTAWSDMQKIMKHLKKLP